jgi:ElaA protein
VEQDCAYLDPDGRDTEAATRHCWIAWPDGIAAYLRITAEPGGEHRIGRVVVSPRARGQGLAGELVRHAVALVPGPLVLDAQSHLTGLYARHGFVQAGEEFVEDGIPHVPMRRPG